MTPRNKETKLEDLIKSENKFPVVGVGASAGGLEAFREFVKGIPEDSGMAYVLVQHLDPEHESILPQLLQKCTQLPVLQISDEVKVQPNHIYIIPSNRMLISNGVRLELSPRPERKKGVLNLPIDLFFESLAEVHQSHSIGVVLSGSGFDGTKGLKAIKDNGGITFAQEEGTAEYPSMPGSAAKEGVVDFVLPSGEIPQNIREVIKSMYGEDGKEKPLGKGTEEVYRQILALLRIRKGTDFTYYKQTTIRRRILRRMALSDINEPEEYIEFLRENTDEQDLLHQDLLIPVTAFFRDEDIFGSLCNELLPEIFNNKSEDEPVRIWVAACSTGQEAYSIAMCLMQCLDETEIKEQVQIFATDISEKSIAKARSGIYKDNELQNLSPEQVDRFFDKVDKKYHVKKELRESCVFASHNFLKDPPFAKMDLITCRNVLIYLQPYLQKKALTTFHYALKPQGHLVLGNSETVSQAPDLFYSSEMNQKIFGRRDRPGKFMEVASPRREENFREFGKSRKTEIARTNFQRTADEIILSRYTPAGVVIDESMEIVHFRGRTGPYLEPQAGKPNLNLLKMARPGLAFELRSIVHHAKQKGETVLRENVPIQESGSHRIISVEAIPLPNLEEKYYLILFHDPAGDAGALSYQKIRKLPSGQDEGDSKDLLILQLERELEQAREDMRSITEDQEATNEELQSANEELQSGSEELQTLNEELETSKEELQSTNEELTSVNQELMSMNRNLTTARDFAVDILETVREPWVVLDGNLKVKSGNQVFYKVFRTTEEEREDKTIFELGNRQWEVPELEDQLRRILTEKSNISDYEVSIDFPEIGQRTMLLNAREVVREAGGEKLILLVFGDITDKRMAEKSLEKSEIKFKLLAETIPQLIWITCETGQIEYFNSKWKHYTGKDLNESLGNKWTGFVHPDDLLQVADTWNECLETGNAFSIECRLKSADDSYNWFLAQALPLYNTDGEIIKWFGSFTNIELQKEAELALIKSREHFRELAELIPEKINYADPSGKVDYYNKRWMDYTGISLEELMKTGWDKVIHPEDREEVLKKWQTSVDTGADLEIEMRIADRRGDYKWHLSRGIPVKDEYGKVKQWIGATTEIEKIKEEEKRKEGFLQLVSHELKTPITSIKGYVQLMLTMANSEKGAAKDSVPLSPYLCRIDEQVSRLTRLIAEMLDLSRIEENKLELKKEVFSLNEFVEETVQDIHRTETEHRMTIHHQFTCEVEADKDRIGQVIINLITNAIKYSPENKEIEVRIFRTEDQKAAVSVKDKGIGISEEDQKEIFKRFHRVAGKNEETYAGLGIGLFLAHEIAERHEGAIKVESEPGEGSVFTFELPYTNKK